MAERGRAAWPPKWLADPAARVDYNERWGPGLSDPTPAVHLPADSWRRRVANLPQAEWSRWRARAGEFLAALGRASNADEIREADRLAALEMGIAGADAPNAPAPTPESDPYAADERAAIRAADGILEPSEAVNVAQP